MVSWDIHVHFKISKSVWMKVQLFKKKYNHYSKILICTMFDSKKCFLLWSIFLISQILLLVVLLNYRTPYFLQPPKSIIAQVQMHHTVPVHAISFNCNDKEANEFLFDLAKATGGRYHYFSEKGKDLDQPESWEVIYWISFFFPIHRLSYPP